MLFPLTTDLYSTLIFPLFTQVYKWVGKGEVLCPVLRTEQATDSSRPAVKSCFCSIKQLRASLLPPPLSQDVMLVHPRATRSVLLGIPYDSMVLFYSPGQREAICSVKFLV